VKSNASRCGCRLVVVFACMSHTCACVCDVCERGSQHVNVFIGNRFKLQRVALICENEWLIKLSGRALMEARWTAMTVRSPWTCKIAKAIVWLHACVHVSKVAINVWVYRAYRQPFHAVAHVTGMTAHASVYLCMTGFVAHKH